MPGTDGSDRREGDKDEYNELDYSLGLLNDVSEFDLSGGAQSMRLSLLPSDYSNGYFSYRARKFP